MKPRPTSELLAASERRGMAGLLALLVHLLFLALLVFAVSWQTRPLPVVAEVWDALPGPEAASPPPAQPPPKPEPPKPEPPKPEPPKPEPPKPEPPKPEPPKPEPAKAKPLPEPRTPPSTGPSKADIAIEKKKEADRLAEVEARHRRELAEAARRDEELRREAEAARAAAVAAEQARQRELEAAQAAAADQQRQREAEVARQAQVAQQARARALDAYISQIRRAVRARMVEPPGIQGNPQAEVRVLQLPTGEVAAAKVTRSSGVPTYDEAVERAVLAASPLPLPSDRSLFSRELILQFRLRE